jgi:putative mRNA 3-end processing factor
MGKLLVRTNKGLYCEKAGVYIDPWRAVNKAFITHGHSDHARRGSKEYLCVRESKNILEFRLKVNNVSSVAYGEKVMVNGVQFSFHPAGHIIGSAQIRVEHKGEVWVVSGDYKTENDSFSGSFEPIKCHTFITECTFGLPIFKWKPQQEVFGQMNNWWAQNGDQGNISMIMAYSLGKAQRLISNLDPGNGKIFTHISIENTNEAIRSAGINLQDTHLLTPDIPYEELQGHMIIAPPGFINSPYYTSLKNVQLAAASGWMNLKRMRNRQALNKAFVLSDHADWDGLLSAIRATEAETILATHGYVKPFSRYLREIGYDAHILETAFEGEKPEPET